MWFLFLLRRLGIASAGQLEIVPELTAFVGAEDRTAIIAFESRTAKVS